MDQRVLDIPIRPETRLSDEPVELFSLAGQFQAGEALEYERVSEVVGCGLLLLLLLLEHEEEEREGVEVMGRVGAPRISADHGVVVVGVGAGDRADEKEASVVEVAGG